MVICSLSNFWQGWKVSLLIVTSLLCCVKNASARYHGYGRGWKLATATWYGSPNGAGTDGGACGYGSLPNTPYGLDVGAGSPILFKNGKGCGSCYKIKCVEEICSSKPVTVVITDECPGGYCAFGKSHFDLSGTAFGSMALNGKTSQLLGSGVLNVLFKRVDCHYEGVRLEFQVNEGSTPYWISILVRYEDGPGDLGAVQLMQGEKDEWEDMHQVWGATWCLNGGASALRGPFSFKVTSLSTKQTIIANNVIPSNWFANVTYSSKVNFT